MYQTSKKSQGDKTKKNFNSLNQGFLMPVDKIWFGKQLVRTIETIEKMVGP